MLVGLRATRHGLSNFRHRGYAYVWANLAFVALSLPVVTAPAAFSALMRVGHLTHTEPGEADLAAFWETFKANLIRALPWGMANVVFAIINFNNIIAYAPTDSFVVSALEGIWIGAAVIWLGMLLFTWPIYFEMIEPTVWGATRNALVMVLRNPIFTLALLVVLTLVAMVSTVLMASWLLLTFGVFAAVANAAVLNRLEYYRKATID